MAAKITSIREKRHALIIVFSLAKAGTPAKTVTTTEIIVADLKSSGTTPRPLSYPRHSEKRRRSRFIQALFANI